MNAAPASKRSDAERNRQRILDAAREALATSGDAAMNAIARSAGVGQGTLYRNFPTREALLLAVYRQDVEELIGLAPALLDRHAPDDALRWWLDRLASYSRIKTGVADAISAATRAELSGEYHDELAAAITMLLDAGKRGGAIRADADAADVLLLVGFLPRIGPEGRASRVEHMLDLVMNALRPPRRQDRGSCKTRC